MATVRYLAARIGPREASSDAFADAADWVAQQFESLGYSVRRQPVSVPAGTSWGVDVAAGMSANVIAAPAGLESGAPYRVVGAHLDTVPQAPGAEDNASGVSVMLEIARMASLSPPRVPVVFVAFGAEEPRGEGDSWHHFGSTAMVERLSREDRRSLVAMVSMDRVGVGTEVPVCSGGLEPPTVRAALLRTAKAQGVPAFACVNQSSDHWSFDKVGLRSARIGGTSYPGYHSPADVPAVVSPRQLKHVATVMWAWLNA